MHHDGYGWCPLCVSPGTASAQSSPRLDASIESQLGVCRGPQLHALAQAPWSGGRGRPKTSAHTHPASSVRSHVTTYVIAMCAGCRCGVCTQDTSPFRFSVFAFR